MKTKLTTIVVLTCLFGLNNSLAQTKSDLKLADYLKGSWQIVYFQDATGTVPVDQNGFLAMPGATDGTEASTYMKIFVTFESSKMKTLVVFREKDTPTESVDEYKVENMVIVSKVEGNDGVYRETRAPIENISANAFESHDDKGNFVKFQKIRDIALDDSVLEPEKSSKSSVMAPEATEVKTECACSEQDTLRINDKFTLLKDIILFPSPKPTNSFMQAIEPIELNYYIDGNRTEEHVLKQMNGQDYCALFLTRERHKPYDLVLPDIYRRNGIFGIPKAANPLVMVSKYFQTVEFKGVTPLGPVGFLVYCGTVDAGDLGKHDKTTLAAIKKNFAGMIEIGQ